MNILNKIGGALETANAAEMESISVLGFFSELPAGPDGRAAPAFGSFSRRRDRYRRR